MAEKKPTKAELAKRERDFKIAQKRLADRFDIDSQNAAIDADDAWRRLQQTRGPARALPTPAPVQPQPRSLFEQQSRLPTSRPMSSILPRQTIEQASQYADPNVLRRMAAQRPRDVRMPIPPRGTPPLNPADMTAAQRFAANPAGGIQGRVRGAPAPLPPQPPPDFLDRMNAMRPLSRMGRILGRVGNVAMGPASLMLEPETAEAPTEYDIEAQHAFGMPMEDFYAQMTPEQDFVPGLDMVPEEMEFMEQQQWSLNPVLNAALGMRGMDVDLSGAFEPGMAEDIPLAEQFTPEDGMSPYEFGQDYLNPAGMSAYEFGQEYLNPLLTSAPTGYSYLQNTLGRGIADLMRGAAGYERLPEEQELIEAVDRPDLAMQPEAAPEPGAAQGITRTPADPFEQQRIALIEEYMQGQQQADPRQRQIMGSADEFAANRPPPRMSQQQLEAALMQLAREESMQATDPFAGYDESLFPEQFVDDRFPRGVTVDPETGFTSFEGGQRYARDAELPGRQSMGDLRLGTEYTSRALRNLGRARGVPSPQEVERSRMLSTLGGDARGQGYRADQIAEQMRRIRSGLNDSNLTPLELQAGQTQLETLGAELAAARGGAEQARALQLQGSMQPAPPAPEDFELQQLQEAETARAQAEAVAEQRRALEELRNTGRNQIDARDMQQYTEMFSSMEPSAVPEGMPLSALDEDMQLQEQGRINRIQLATTLASSHEGFRTQPALAMEAARLLATLRGDPRRQTGYMNLILEADPSELGQVIQELYDRLGAT